MGSSGGVGADEAQDVQMRVVMSTPYLALVIMCTCGLLFGFMESYIWVNAARHARTESLQKAKNDNVNTGSPFNR